MGSGEIAEQAWAWRAALASLGEPGSAAERRTAERVDGALVAAAAIARLVTVRRNAVHKRSFPLQVR